MRRRRQNPNQEYPLFYSCAQRRRNVGTLYLTAAGASSYDVDFVVRGSYAGSPTLSLGVEGARRPEIAAAMFVKSMVDSSAWDPNQVSVARHHANDVFLAAMENEDIAEALRCLGTLDQDDGSRKKKDFESDFREAFDMLREERGYNLVKLLSLRNALPQYSRKEFDTKLRELRMKRPRPYILERFDGRHGVMSQEEQDAGIMEAGHRYVFVMETTEE